jgi:hypothetical protein
MPFVDQSIIEKQLNFSQATVSKAFKDANDISIDRPG